MDTHLLIYLYLFVATFFICSSVFVKKDTFCPNVLYVFVYLYATLGPVINIVFYGKVSLLVASNYLDQTLICFIIAVAAFSIGGLLPKKIGSEYLALKGSSEQLYFNSILNITSFFSFLIIFYMVLNANIILKLDKGYFLANQISPGFHRLYILLMFVLLPLTYLNSVKLKIKSKKLKFNLIIYMFYMMVVQERDFVLILLSFVMINHYYVKKISYKKAFGYTFLAMFLFSSLFYLRVVLSGDSQESTIISNLLGQGSNVIVTSNLLEYVENPQHDYLYGYTYLQSIVNLTPSFIFRLGTPLTDWFVMEFFPDSNSGYGFTLEGEAILNGGYIMVFVFFIIFGYYVDLVYRKMMAGMWLNESFYFYFFPFILYSTRGDSLMLFKGSVTGFVLILLIYIFASKGIFSFRKVRN